MNNKYITIVFVLLFVAGAAGWLVTMHFQSEERQLKEPLIELRGEAANGAPAPQIPSDDAIAVKIYLPSADGITVEERRIRNNPIPVRMAEEVVSEYLKGLKDDLKNVKVLGVYRDKRSIIYIDLSDDFKKKFSGDIRDEHDLLKSLYETITINIPGTEDVRLLVDGKEIESIGGHFNALCPLGDVFKEDVQQQPAAQNPKTS